MSSKRRLRRQSCEGKRAFESAAAAMSTASAMARREGQRPLNAYACRFCGRWHLGHPPKRIRQAIAAHKARKAKKA